MQTDIDENQVTKLVSSESINNQQVTDDATDTPRPGFLSSKNALVPEIKITDENVFKNTAAEPKPITKPSVSTLSNWPVVLLMLLGIVCLIFGLAWFVKRFGGFNMTGGRDMRVLSSVPLGARERVALIDVKGQQFLIGVTTQNINHLHTFDEPVVDTSNNDTKNLGVSGFPKSDFAKKFQQILTTTKPSGDERV